MSAFDPDHTVAHVASLGGIVGTLSGHLPAVAAAVGGVWYGLQVWESETVQGWRITKALITWWRVVNRT